MDTFLLQPYQDEDNYSPRAKLVRSNMHHSFWAENWQCPMCDHVYTEEDELHAPLHNPLYCSGKASGDEHPAMPCNPLIDSDIFMFVNGGFADRFYVGTYQGRGLKDES